MRTYLRTSFSTRFAISKKLLPRRKHGESDNSRANICRSIFKEIVRFVYEDLIREKEREGPGPSSPLPIIAIFREIEEFQQLE